MCPRSWLAGYGCCPPAWSQDRRGRRAVCRIAAWSGPALQSVQTNQGITALRALTEHRDDLVYTRTQTINRLHARLGKLIPSGLPRGLTAETPRLRRCTKPPPAPRWAAPCGNWPAICSPICIGSTGASPAPPRPWPKRSPLPAPPLTWSSLSTRTLLPCEIKKGGLHARVGGRVGCGPAQALATSSPTPVKVVEHI